MEVRAGGGEQLYGACSQSITPNASTALLKSDVINQNEPLVWKQGIGFGTIVLFASIVSAIVLFGFAFFQNKNVESSTLELDFLSSKRSHSFDSYVGGPPRLSAVPRSEWVRCEDYSEAQLLELKTWEQYWLNRSIHDESLKNLLNSMDVGDEKREQLAKRWPNASKTYHSCEYYSAGLSGPYNALKKRPKKHGLERISRSFNSGINVSRRGLQWFDDDGDDDISLFDDWGFDDDDDDNSSFDDWIDDDTISFDDDDWEPSTPNCTFSPTELIFGCDWSYIEYISIVDTSTIDFYAVAEAVAEFDTDCDACDIGVDIGGDIYLGFEVDSGIYDYEVTVNVLQSPSVDAQVEEIDVTVTYEIFTLEIEFINPTMTDDYTGKNCNLTLWEIALAPGYDVYIFSDTLITVVVGDVEFTDVTC